MGASKEEEEVERWLLRGAAVVGAGVGEGREREEAEAREGGGGGGGGWWGVHAAYMMEGGRAWCMYVRREACVEGNCLAYHW